MARKRPSMKGMGADAFFETPGNQEASTSGKQQASMPVNQQDTKPASQLTGVAQDELIKATFYLTQDHIMKLEHIRLGRKQKGIKIDKSALVREAIDLLQE